jgi:hypothetical protein
MSGNIELDPQWDEVSIGRDAPEVENGGLPEMIHILGFEMPSTLEVARREGMIFPDGSPNFVTLAQMSSSLLEYSPLESSLLEPDPPEEWRGPSPTAPPPSMDGANSVTSMRLGSGSEPASDESNANKFPDEKHLIGINKRDSRLPPPEPDPEPSDSTASGSSVLMHTDDERKSRPWRRIKDKDIVNPDDEITPAPPLWDEEPEYDYILQPPDEARPTQGAFNPDPHARNTRTIRQRIASARQTLRDVVQEDREWIRGAMVRIGIRSEPDPGENERPPARDPEPAAEGPAPDKPSRGARIKARVTPYLSLRGGSGRRGTGFFLGGESDDDDITPIDLSQDNTPSGGQSQDNARPGDQSQDNNRPREQSQDNSRPGSQWQDNNRSREQSQNSTPQREERQNSGSTEISSPRPLLSPSRQLRASFHDQSPRAEDRYRRSEISERPPPPELRHSFPFQGQQGPINQSPRGRPSEYTHPLARVAEYQNRLQNSPQTQPIGAAGPGIYGGDPYPRPPSRRRGYRQYDPRISPGDVRQYRGVSSGSLGSNSVYSGGSLSVGQDGSQDERQPEIQNASENIGLAVSHDRGPNDGQNDDQNASQNAGQNASPNEDENADQKASPDDGQNAGQNASPNEDENADQKASPDDGQNAGQNASPNEDENANQKASPDEGQNAGQNASPNEDEHEGLQIHRRVPEHLVEDYLNARAATAQPRRRRDRLPTLSKATSKKVKEKMMKFATLGRRPREPEAEPTGGVLEEHFTPSPPATPSAPPANPPPPPPNPLPVPVVASIQTGAPVPLVVEVPNAAPESGIRVTEQAYSTNSLTRGRFNMWPFNRKKSNVSINF